MERTVDVLREVLSSRSLCNSSGEVANVVDALHEIAQAGFAIANAITERAKSPGQGANGGHVGCLTESIMDLAQTISGIVSSLETLEHRLK